MALVVENCSDPIPPEERKPATPSPFVRLLIDLEERPFVGDLHRAAGLEGLLPTRRENVVDDLGSKHDAGKPRASVSTCL